MLQLNSVCFGLAWLGVTGAQCSQLILRDKYSQDTTQ
jgi:hypothetical protein